jgi:hypothetical protein
MTKKVFILFLDIIIPKGSSLLEWELNLIASVGILFAALFEAGVLKVKFIPAVLYTFLREFSTAPIFCSD